MSSPVGPWAQIPLNELLLRLWTKAVGTPDYNKEEWKELELRISGSPSHE
jgi:hypothetical protein